ncbi:hypothetical protein RM572_14425 [Streptomyces sp. DSM 42041]|uniref:Metallopeptidase domain-containing protein n=1 Tax=Streptomyces hazeniae TaxID=3075538 RepID=A0ABU2NTY6_9ACTN|nr:hypothetical protein [Streptomyces sp. DSM 42041]MDT0379957.1 hypothetical protein [Streptomyces sp. DSM 42041]
MSTVAGRAADPVERGFPHLPTVRSAVTALYRRLSADTVDQFGVSVAPADVAFGDGDDLHLGAQRVAGALVRHLRLPQARIIVSFRSMDHAASVELAAGPEYFVELNERFRTHRRDVGAALAHEVMHVYLHRLDLAFRGVPANEILTDTAAAFLGSGWLLLDAFRQDGVSSQKLGYLTPEEFGYVLAKRAAAFGEDPSPWFTSPQAYEAYVAGRARARRDVERPPLAGAGRVARRAYVRDRRWARRWGRPAGRGALSDGEGYVFEPGGTGEPGGPRGTGAQAGADGGAGADGMRVAFACPTCFQRLRVPVRGPVRARCGLCRSVLDCDT